MNTLISFPRSSRTQLALWLLFTVTFVVAAINSSGQVASNDAERLVLARVKIDGKADLDQAGLKDNGISHKFLEDLITSPQPTPAVSTYGLTILHATIHGRLSVGSVTIPFPLTFDHCTFEDGFDLSSNVFSHDFLLENSKVGSPSGSSTQLEAPTFIGDRFAGRVNLDGSHFYNGVDFTNASIDGVLESSCVDYASEQDEADFESIKVKGRTTFQHSKFKSGLDLSGAEMANLVVIGGGPSAQCPLEPAPMNLLIDHASIGKGMVVQDMALSGFDGRLVNIQGETDLRNVQPVGRMYFNGAQFNTLAISGLDTWPNNARNIQLDGLSYGSIAFPSSKTKPPEKEWLALIDKTPYAPQSYLELEKFLRSRLSPDADEVYFRMRRRAREDLPSFPGFLDWVQDWLLGYGRKLWRAGLVAFGLVCLGAFLFQKSRMEPEDSDCTDTWYNPFWFSLDLLSPIDLGVSKRWRAKHPILRNYSQMHRVAGWILIPLIVAAITGIIK